MEEVIVSETRYSGRARPARDVLMALAIKGLLLLALYALFFAPSHRPASTAVATASALIGAQ